MGLTVPDSAQWIAGAREWIQGAAAQLRRQWALWLSFLAAALAAGVGLNTGLARLVERWNFNYSHGWLVLAMCAWLLARSLRSATRTRPAPSVGGVAAVSIAVLLYVLAEALDTTLGMFLMLPAIVLAVIAALAGFPVARAAAFPLGLLFFAIPVWDYLAPPLQRVAVGVVQAVLSWTGPPTHVVGNLITIPAGTFEVEESCAGVRYLLVSLAISAFYGLAWYTRWRSRLLLLAVAAVGAMVSNWIRIYSLVQIGHATSMQHDLIAVSHVNFGWFLYAIFLIPVLWVAEVIRRRDDAGAPSAPPGVSPAVAKASLFAVAAPAVSLMLAGPVLLRDGSQMVSTESPAQIRMIAVPGWEAVSQGSWKPEFLSPSFSASQSLFGPGDPQIDVFIAHYGRLGRGAKLFSRHNHLHPGWQVVHSGVHGVRAGGMEHTVAALELATGSERRLLWYWYVIGGKYAHGKLQAKLLEVAGYLRGRRDGAVLAVSASCVPDCPAAARAVEEFLHEAGPLLQDMANGKAGASVVPRP